MDEMGGIASMTVLCVDDHPILLQGLAQSVHLAGPDADVACFSNARDAMSYAEEHGCDVRSLTNTCAEYKE